jgi:hypothetical protein
MRPPEANIVAHFAGATPAVAGGNADPVALFA